MNLFLGCYPGILSQGYILIWLGNYGETNTPKLGTAAPFFSTRANALLLSQTGRVVRTQNASLFYIFLQVVIFFFNDIIIELRVLAGIPPVFDSQADVGYGRTEFMRNIIDKDVFHFR